MSPARIVAWPLLFCAACASSPSKPAAGPAAPPPPAALASAGPVAAPAASAGPATEPAALAPLAPLPAPTTPEPDGNAVATAPPADSAAAPPPVPAAAPGPVAPAAPGPRAILVADEPPFSSRPHAKAEHRHEHEDHGEKGHRGHHPAPGIVVDVVGVDAGGPAASAADMQRAARNAGYWPFRDCYEQGLRRDQQLAGKVFLELQVNPTGGVDRATVVSSTVHDDIVGACVAREAAHLALPRGESPATARVEVTLALGDEPVPAGRTVPNAERLQQALRGSWRGVRQCYASALAGHPDAGGRLELHFKVHHDGEVSEVTEVGETHFATPDVTRCVVGVYRGAKLPALHAARDHAFVYALELESKPGE